LNINSVYSMLKVGFKFKIKK